MFTKPVLNRVSRGQSAVRLNPRLRLVRCQTSPAPPGSGRGLRLRAVPARRYFSTMPLRWDPLLVRALARELDHRLAGARLRAIRLDGIARRVTLLLREATLDW